MILIGGAFVARALEMAVVHFGVGVPVYNRTTGQPSSDLAVASLALASEGIGVLLAVWDAQFFGRHYGTIANGRSRKQHLITRTAIRGLQSTFTPQRRCNSLPKIRRGPTFGADPQTTALTRRHLRSVRGSDHRGKRVPADD